MKLIKAIIKEEKVDQVREALIEADITRITVSRVSGHGQMMGEDLHRGQKIVPNLTSKVRVEIAVNEEFVDVTCDTIIKYARSNDEGKVGDGKIFICPLDECIRIRTGEKGGKAI